MLEHWPARPDAGEPIGAILALHGGRPKGRRRVGRTDLPYLRMRRLVRRVHEVVAPHGVEMWLLRYGQQGWNGRDASPVADARRALAEIDEAAPGRPVVLLGHSMGGRTALRVAGEQHVVGVVALAPWLPDGERLGDLVDRRLVIAHGVDDRTTDPRASRRYASAAHGIAAHVRHVDVEGDRHALLKRAAEWNRLAADAALEMFGVSR